MIYLFYPNGRVEGRLRRLVTASEFWRLPILRLTERGRPFLNWQKFTGTYCSAYIPQSQSVMWTRITYYIICFGGKKVLERDQMGPKHNVTIRLVIIIFITRLSKQLWIHKIIWTSLVSFNLLLFFSQKAKKQ